MPAHQGRSSRRRFAIVIPVYNHALNMEQVAREALKLGFPVIVVDDGSTDDTRRRLEPFMDCLNYSLQTVVGFAAQLERPSLLLVLGELCLAPVGMSMLTRLSPHRIVAMMMGVFLLAISASDGSELARYPISAPPVFDGMAAAGGQLLLSLENGQLLCMGAK